MPTFLELGVPAPLAAVLAADGKTEAFAIQRDTLPDSLAGRDLLGRGRTGSGKTIAFNDQSADRLNKAALAAKDDPMAFLALGDIFGDVARSGLFRRRFADALKTLWEKGTRATLQLYLDGKLEG